MRYKEVNETVIIWNGRYGIWGAFKSELNVSKEQLLIMETIGFNEQVLLHMISTPYED